MNKKENKASAADLFSSQSLLERFHVVLERMVHEAVLGLSLDEARALGTSVLNGVRDVDLGGETRVASADRRHQLIDHDHRARPPDASAVTGHASRHLCSVRRYIEPLIFAPVHCTVLVRLERLIISYDFKASAIPAMYNDGPGVRAEALLHCVHLVQEAKHDARVGGHAVVGPLLEQVVRHLHRSTRSTSRASTCVHLRSAHMWTCAHHTTHNE